MQKYIKIEDLSVLKKNFVNSGTIVTARKDVEGLWNDITDLL